MDFIQAIAEIERQQAWENRDVVLILQQVSQDAGQQIAKEDNNRVKLQDSIKQRSRKETVINNKK